MTDQGGQARTIADYAAAVASANPTPGGGSVVATVAAFAAGLAEMVAGLTLARPQNGEVEAALTAARDEAARLRERLLRLASEDERAYAGYRTAAALPKGSAEEKARRRAALEEALVTAAETPLAVVQACHALLVVLRPIAEHGTAHAEADVRTGADLAHAALLGAERMVRANTSLMRDRTRAEALDERVTALTVDSGSLTGNIGLILDQRAGDSR